MPRAASTTSTLSCLLVALVFAGLAGCGSTKQHSVTEQLLSSDAVDRAVAQIDFRLLRGRKVYLDTSYIQPVKSAGFVNDRYIVSSLRQQLAAAGGLMQESAKDADVIVEARVGALGTETHEVIYGLPANNFISSVASIAPNAPQIPTIPEISVARKERHRGAAKLAVFAYERESKAPLWQSGIAQSESRAQDVWVLGAGPFQTGTIYDAAQFAGSELHLPLVSQRHRDDAAPRVDHQQEYVFDWPSILEAERQAAEAKGDTQPANPVQQAGHEEPVNDRPPTPAKSDAAQKTPSPPPGEDAPEPASQAQPTETTTASQEPHLSSAPMLEPLRLWSDAPGGPFTTRNPWYVPAHAESEGVTAKVLAAR